MTCYNTYSEIAGNVEYQDIRRFRTSARNKSRSLTIASSSSRVSLLNYAVQPFWTNAGKMLSF